MVSLSCFHIVRRKKCSYESKVEINNNNENRMTRIVMTAPPGKQDIEEELPTGWTIKEVERVTGLAVVDAENRENWVVCILANGVRFSFKKW